MGMGMLGPEYGAAYGFAPQPYYMQSSQYAAAAPYGYAAQAATPAAAPSAAGTAATGAITTQQNYTGAAYSTAEDYFKTTPAAASAATADPSADPSAPASGTSNPQAA